MKLLRLTLSLAVLVLAAAGQAPLFKVLDAPVPTGGTLFGLGVGDFDGDGDQDLLGWGSVFVNDGHGRFSEVTTSLVTGYPRIVADLNGDGLADVASIDFTGVPFVRIELNVGGFAFGGQVGGQPTLVPAGVYPSNLAAADVDNDGDVDLMIGTMFPFSGLPGLVNLWLNNGSGIFVAAPPASMPAIALVTDHMFLHDLDNDGDPDAVFVGSPGRIALNSGGVFTLSPTSFVGAAGIDVGRFNGDAYADLVFAYGGIVYFMFGSAAGPLAPVASPSTPVPLFSLVAVDLNGDGVDELVERHASDLTTHAVSPIGVVSPAIQTLANLAFSNQTAPGFDWVRDLDGDGDRDLIAVTAGSTPLLMNDGAGHLVLIGGRVAPLGIKFGDRTADVDGDGDRDIVGFMVESYPWLIATGLNDGNGNFVPGPTSPLAAPAMSDYGTSLYPFDRDGDGDDDLYVTGNVSALYGTGPWFDVVFDNQGGTFTPIATIPAAGGVAAFVAADFDGDGDRDVVLGRRGLSSNPASLAQPLVFVRNLGGAGFAAPVAFGGSHATNDLDLGDFDGNGTIDFFQTNRMPGGVDPSVVYLTSGTGSATAIVQPAMSGDFTAAGDLNGDGRTDLVIDGGVFFASGGGSFVAGPVLPSPLLAPASLADVDLDGDLDLLETPATVMFNLGGSVFGLPQSYLARAVALPLPVDSDLLPTSVADLDRDGDPDLVVPGPTAVMNTLRQIAGGSIPRPGLPASIDLYGSPNGVWFLWVSSGTAAFPLPPWGTVLIDPAYALPVSAGGFPPIGSPSATATFAATTPNVPALVGLTTYWQAIDFASTRFTNRIAVTIMGY